MTTARPFATGPVSRCRPGRIGRSGWPSGLDARHPGHPGHSPCPHRRPSLRLAGGLVPLSQGNSKGWDKGPPFRSNPVMDTINLQIESVTVPGLDRAICPNFPVPEREDLCRPGTIRPNDVNPVDRPRAGRPEGRRPCPY
jgi:hypothetical protein